jgi:hypothetical protein
VAIPSVLVNGHLFLGGGERHGGDVPGAGMLRGEPASGAACPFFLRDRTQHPGHREDVLPFSYRLLMKKDTDTMAMRHLAILERIETPHDETGV